MSANARSATRRKATIGNLTLDQKIVDSKSDRFARTQTDLSLGGRDNTALSIGKRFEHTDLVGARRQPEMIFKRLPRYCTSDIDAITRQAK